MYQLKIATDPAWVDVVLNDFDRFLLDHASCEKKASSMAMTLVSHYPDRTELVTAMTELAIEELNHFKEVVRYILSRNLRLAADQKDPYVAEFFRHTRKGREPYFLDRLIVASIVEARGHERFGLIAEALAEGPLKQFYKAITTSEGRHLDLFHKLAYTYFPQAEVTTRTEELLTIEADIISRLPHRAALH
ncbi:tRNA-(ms[2]io[6]A)-hydroxylase [Ketobacter sp. MCCC 1A13808]|uniref:tRNA-(ms[2]io[6]A)-hydroxylase n=1 Tax=Ketobacter sp. MCCC 1A13808 TaxID=2602738 RepID=UPI000F27F487|nr:tRNA-(ms[2]io[6]A)-hydroxylase [Ketobacter sp. MCCC 1A13808]MVF10984.1 tRNA-(ms[2]io[6]A)-hydroxylase [Ketobacter sp. MCCC 1A13808]RLP56372.1 MAG: tRNA-(ms[2]io[6]A)-hydroxylase [Ketobacter sp.]